MNSGPCYSYPELTKSQVVVKFGPRREVSEAMKGLAMLFFLLVVQNPSTYGTFTSRLSAGADCPELFKIRNDIKQADPKNKNVDRMNEQLRNIGCYSSTSHRNDRDKQPPPRNKETFTVKEYRIYRAVIDTPLSASDTETFKKVGSKYQVPPSSVEPTARKVQKILADNRWLGTATSEIRRARDWAGEKQ
jgi:hypothetical protein